MKHIKNFNEKEVKDNFISLIGENEIDIIENENWCKFKRLHFEIYKTNEIVINFLTKDGKGDRVIFCSIHYNEDIKKWHSENGVEYPYPKFNSYKEMKEHLLSLEDKIIDNGFDVVYF